MVHFAVGDTHFAGGAVALATGVGQVDAGAQGGVAGPCCGACFGVMGMRFVSLFSVMLLSGCSLVPFYETPKTVVPAQWSQMVTLHGQGYKCF